MIMWCAGFFWCTATVKWKVETGDGHVEAECDGQELYAELSGKERTEESFEKFFTLIEKELAEKIEFVCSDMWKPYLKLIAKHCTNALNNNRQPCNAPYLMGLEGALLGVLMRR